MSKVKLSEVEQHLSCVIDFVDKSNNIQISTYYNHMKRLCDLIVKEICDTPQKKIGSFFKPNK
ncbi:hypothetical protein L9F63_016444 [Diploptera punctata]|uniref:Uncharacterized protein n=1 Tax=Diploptera punctata TaxID=6984 RepID=A0AAD8A1B5_DIPPU|nr:hypothetical protein L9F63_016444 [Diploptera punctata]